MLQVYKILHGIDDINPEVFFTQGTNHQTRGHSHKLYKNRCKTAKRAGTFSFRVINNWNSLPEEVANANTLNSFKNGLNNAWKNKPSKFND